MTARRGCASCLVRRAAAADALGQRPAGRNAGWGRPEASGEGFTRTARAAEAGNHQFQRPNSAIGVGTSSARMIVTSMMIARPARSRTAGARPWSRRRSP